LEKELGEALGHKVDLLTEAGLSPYLRERILKEKTRLTQRVFIHIGPVYSIMSALGM